MNYKKIFPINWDENLTEGEILEGIVKNIKPYGAFIQIKNGQTGLLPIENISISRIKSPEERLKIGQKINIVVKSIDKVNKRVLFSHKELLGTWEENIKDISQGNIVKGTVRDKEKYNNGIFIELKPNLVGLAEYKPGIEYGQNVDVYVKKIIPEKKKIKLKIL